MTPATTKRFAATIALTALAFLSPAIAAPSSDDAVLSGAFWYVVDHLDPALTDAEATVWMTIPPDRPGQRIAMGEFRPRASERIESADGENSYVVWEVGTAGREYLNLGYSFTVRFEDVDVDVEPDLVEPPDVEGELYRAYTRSEFGIETGGPVAALAGRIVGDETHPWRRAKLIFDWMVQNMVFVPGGEGENRAESVCHTLRGDCGQYALLFSALCRTLCIPARPVTGAWLDGGRHRWAEFHLPPYGWIPADPSAAQALISGKTTLTEQESAAFAEVMGLDDGDPDRLFGRRPSRCLVTFVGNHALATAGALRQPRTTRRGVTEAAPLAARFSGTNHDIAHGGFFLFGDSRIHDPSYVRDQAYQRLASSYFDAGLYEEIEASCLKAVVAEPDVVTAWMNLGRVYMSKRQFRKAEASFNRALLGHSSSQVEKLESMIWTRNYLGNCYDLLGFRNLALEQYGQVIEIGNNYRGALDYARRYAKQPFGESDL